MSALAEFICGSVYVPDWNAVSAIGTTAAAIVALLLASRDRRMRLLE